MTLPAWMTSGGNAAQDIVVKTSESTENAPVDGVKIESNSDAGGRGLIQSGAAVDVTHKALGRGRGRERTLPAWATEPDLGAKQIAPLVGRKRPPGEDEESDGHVFNPAVAVLDKNSNDLAKDANNADGSNSNSKDAADAADALLGSLAEKNALPLPPQQLPTKKKDITSDAGEESAPFVDDASSITTAHNRGKVGISASVKMAIAQLNRSLNLGFSNLNLLYDALAKDEPLVSFLGKAVADMNICRFMHAHFITTSARTEGWKNVEMLGEYRDSLSSADVVLGNLLPEGNHFWTRLWSQDPRLKQFHWKERLRDF